MTSLRKRESLRIKNQESMRQNDLTTPPSSPPPSPTKRAAERRGMAPDSPASQSRGGSTRGRSATLPSAPSDWPQVEHLNGTEASPRRRSARLRSPARNGHSGSFDTILYGSLYRPGEIFDDEQMMASPKDLLSVISTATRPDLSDAVVPRRRKRDIARPIVLKGLMSGLIYMLGQSPTPPLHPKPHSRPPTPLVPGSSPPPLHPIPAPPCPLSLVPCSPFPFSSPLWAAIVKTNACRRGNRVRVVTAEWKVWAVVACLFQEIGDPLCSRGSIRKRAHAPLFLCGRGSLDQLQVEAPQCGRQGCCRSGRVGMPLEWHVHSPDEHCD